MMRSLTSYCSLISSLFLSIKLLSPDCVTSRFFASISQILHFSKKRDLSLKTGSYHTCFPSFREPKYRFLKHRLCSLSTMPLHWSCLKSSKSSSCNCAPRKLELNLVVHARYQGLESCLFCKISNLVCMIGSFKPNKGDFYFSKFMEMIMIISWCKIYMKNETVEFQFSPMSTDNDYPKQV